MDTQRIMETEAGKTGQINDISSSISITVKVGGRSIPISLSAESTVKDLKSLLQSLTDVLPHGQKLICKGKILADTMTLSQANVSNGAKVMLMASQGLHQGDAPVLKEAQTRPISRASISYRTESKKPAVLVDKNRVERWKVTGVIALAECNLKSIPREVWDCGSTTIRVLDVSNNSLQQFPENIGSLSSLQKLFLNANNLSDQSIRWEGITQLKFVTVLSLAHNQLTYLPAALGHLSSLTQLHVSNNKLRSLPTEIGNLNQLEILKANNNRISSIPASIGNCKSLHEVDLSSNLLSELPETFSDLQNLKALHLSNNGLKSLPFALFKECSQLSTLDLHKTEVSVERLRQYEGWDDFDERRRTKHQKQLDFRVVGSGEFDEGADKSW